jgi:hypothetical protein
MTRQRELEALMTKAGTATGGQIASSMAYRPEYNQLRGEMVQLRKARGTRIAGLPLVLSPGAGTSAPARMALSQEIVR